MLAFSWFSELLSCAIRSLCKRIPFKLIVKRLALLSLFFYFFNLIHLKLILKFFALFFFFFFFFFFVLFLFSSSFQSDFSLL